MNVLDVEGKTPLYLAVERDNWQYAESLLNWGAESDVAVELKDGDTITPLRRAVQKGHCVAAGVLLGVGADPELIRSMPADVYAAGKKSGLTPLHEAVYSGNCDRPQKSMTVISVASTPRPQRGPSVGRGPARRSRLGL